MTQNSNRSQKHTLRQGFEPATPVREDKRLNDSNRPGQRRWGCWRRTKIPDPLLLKKNKVHSGAGLPAPLLTVSGDRVVASTLNQQVSGCHTIAGVEEPRSKSSNANQSASGVAVWGG